MRDGFEALYRAQYAAVHRFATRRLSGPGVDDIVASTFELAWRKLPDDHPQPVGWLIRTAGNLVKAELRRQARERRALRDADLRGASDEDRSALDTLDRLLGQLPSAQREILQLAYWDGLTAAQIAVVLGCSEQAAWKRISRAKATLRAAWPTDPPSDREEAETYASERDG
ncbi:sigma-70 family RNA polymerase sigma factor [Microbacterium sp. CFH 90308]|uniref:Sigma-70 family RNA polymerase sigma factor n=1 Tax=Microbacterium salsuginis TaxID=2722803 RepID=A0ABX1K5I6_9MICO|nr:sigma-70 family RNA polymerase sigma factor [Microbacterium sp. CFH 90308]NLP82258.1 sigma-70 family RNA polymerase sigma factor [Microbacterium sp. CFH 90308]